eukprot:353806-Chlamydomonas_euryale.AAC.2
MDGRSCGAWTLDKGWMDGHAVRGRWIKDGWTVMRCVDVAAVPFFIVHVVPAGGDGSDLAKALLVNLPASRPNRDRPAAP